MTSQPSVISQYLVPPPYLQPTPRVAVAVAEAAPAEKAHHRGARRAPCVGRPSTGGAAVVARGRGSVRRGEQPLAAAARRIRGGEQGGGARVRQLRVARVAVSHKADERGRGRRGQVVGG